MIEKGLHAELIAAYQASQRLQELRKRIDPSTLRAARREVPQITVAKMAGVLQTYVSYVENGILEKVPDYALIRLLEAYIKLETADESCRSA